MSVILKQLQATCIMAELENTAYGLGRPRVKTNREILFACHYPEKPDQLHAEEEKTIKAPHSLPDGCWRLWGGDQGLL